MPFYLICAQAPLDALPLIAALFFSSVNFHSTVDLLHEPVTSREPNGACNKINADDIVITEQINV